MSKKKAYVIGNNVKTSLSPTIFQHWFEKYNIDGEYGYVEIEEKDFDQKIKILLKEVGLVGLNITIPFKEKIISYLTSQDEHVTEIGAVNCVTINDKNTISGTNTDWIGFMNVLENFTKNHAPHLQRSNSPQGMLPKEKYNLEKYGPNHEKTKYLQSFKHDTAVVVGYGGAGKAVVYSLAQMNFRRIKVFNRTFEKIKNIETNVIKPFKLEELLKHTMESSVTINTTPSPNILGELGMPHNYYDRFIDHYNVGADINYKKTMGTSPFNGYFFSAHRIHGIDMLVSQALPCFERWFGVLPKLYNDPELGSKLLKIIKNK